MGEVTTQEALVVGNIRLPRVITAALVGAALGTAGAVMQALFRNPLAEPGVTGVSDPKAKVAPLAASLANGLSWVPRSGPSRRAYIWSGPPQAASNCGCIEATTP